MKYYFDNASTTKVNDDVLKTYIEHSKDYYNPSALYSYSNEIKKSIEDSRKNIINYLKGEEKSKFIFTSCATEANNAVIHSFIKRKDKHYIISAGEHSSIYEPIKALINEGYDIDLCPLNKDGTVNQSMLYSMVSDKTCFVSIIHVSNETGAVNDIETISKQIKKINKNVILHSDGVQALHKLDINLTKLGVDLYTISAHKINGIKGVAGLYIAPNVKFSPLLLGGGQELNLRGGTENYAGIKAFDCAILKTFKPLAELEKLKKHFLNNLEVEYELISSGYCVPNIIAIAFEGVRGETLVHMLDDLGFLVGTGSACNSKNTTNRVLDAIGIDKKLSLGNIRISFDENCCFENIACLAKAINKCVKEYRNKIVR